MPRFVAFATKPIFAGLLVPKPELGNQRKHRQNENCWAMLLFAGDGIMISF
jgi:hypothetical protein